MRQEKAVSLQSILRKRDFQKSLYDLPIALGKTSTNEVCIVDLCDMPHILIAGTTGTGKTVCIHTIITSLLYKKHPRELKFVLIDTRMIELNVYSSIENHFLAKLPNFKKFIISDLVEVMEALNSLHKEMSDRYDLLMALDAQNIKHYNKILIKGELNSDIEHKYMPYIVVIIDEFGYYMTKAASEIEMLIARIAQSGQTVGIHMIIATQRPTANIITECIKSNFPARIAFFVTSKADSFTLIDGIGAEELFGSGNMIFKHGIDQVRLRCPFIDIPEIEDIVDYISQQKDPLSTGSLPDS